jgi:glycosyltransferase involved in cell wall biosynthesis
MGHQMTRAVGLVLDWKPVTWSTREEFIALTACRLKQRGIRTVVVCPEGLGELRSRFDVEVAVSPVSSTSDYLPFFRHLGDAVRKFGIDTVHVRFFPYFSLVPWIARMLGVRHILYTEANSGEWDESGLKAAAVRARTRIACHPVTQHVAISEFIKQRMVRVGIPADRIEVIYNGVNTRDLLPDPAARPRLVERVGARESDVLILTASTLLPWKNTRTLIEALAVLRQRGVPGRLILAGAGPLRAELEAVASERGVSPYCHFLGHTDVYAVIQGCDLFAHAAIGEAFGNVLAEAMACERPVVGGDSGAMSEIVEHGRTGLIVPPRDPAAFADALETLAGDAALRRSMGLAARERACRMFSVEAMVDAHMRLYDRLWAGDRTSKTE